MYVNNILWIILVFYKYFLWILKSLDCGMNNKRAWHFEKEISESFSLSPDCDISRHRLSRERDVICRDREAYKQQYIRYCTLTFIAALIVVDSMTASSSVSSTWICSIRAPWRERRASHQELARWTRRRRSLALFASIQHPRSRAHTRSKRTGVNTVGGTNGGHVIASDRVAP